MNGVSDPYILDPVVTFKTPGIYKFKLTSEGLNAKNLVVPSVVLVSKFVTFDIEFI